MTTDRLLKLGIWLYLAALVALTLVHIDVRGRIGDPFDIYRVVALCLGGLLARRAYPGAPSLAFLMMIGTVCAFGIIHMFRFGNGGRPLDIIIDMASGMWGVALGASADRLWRLSTLRRNAADL